MKNNYKGYKTNGKLLLLQLKGLGYQNNGKMQNHIFLLLRIIPKKSIVFVVEEIRCLELNWTG